MRRTNPSARTVRFAVVNEQWKPSEPEVEQLEKVLGSLGEQWENIQVFLNRTDPNGHGTQKLIMGRGNFYARKGQVRDWLDGDDESTREESRRGYDCGG